LNQPLIGLPSAMAYIGQRKMRLRANLGFGWALTSCAAMIERFRTPPERTL
jgi:hypothetical protein